MNTIEYQVIRATANLAHKLAKQQQKDVHVTTGERITLRQAAQQLQQENVDYTAMIHKQLANYTS